MRLSHLMPSRYVIPSPSKYYNFAKRRRSLQQKEERLQQEQDEQSLLEEEPECGATLFNVEMVALEDQSTLVFEEGREAMTGEAEESQEIRQESPNQRQDASLGDIRKYGLVAECREEAADRDHEMQLRKVAKRNKSKKLCEENDCGPALIDTLCFSAMAAPEITEESHNEHDASEIIKLDQDAPPKPFRLVGGYMYKNHKDDHMGMSIKDSMTKAGIYISNLHMGSRLKWSTDVALDNMRILSINGLACPSDLEATVDMMQQTEGDLKLIAAIVDPPKPIAPLEDDEDTVANEDQEADNNGSESEVSSQSEGDGEDGVSALTDEKERATQTGSQETNHDGENKEQEDAAAPESTPDLELVRQRSRVQCI